VKTLILYGTRHGATKATSEEIAKALREMSFEVKVVNAQEEKVKDISGYELIIVGSSLANCRWNNQAEDFLKKFRKEFEGKKLALFVSSVAPIAEREGNTEEVAKERIHLKLVKVKGTLEIRVLKPNGVKIIKNASSADPHATIGGVNIQPMYPAGQEVILDINEEESVWFRGLGTVCITSRAEPKPACPRCEHKKVIILEHLSG
jgi:menaquinone-dependent protoporphyrinogen IX oxidase